MSKIFKSTKVQKNEARKRLKNSVREKGTDQEYYEELLTTYRNFEDTRKRISND